MDNKRVSIGYRILMIVLVFLSSYSAVVEAGSQISDSDPNKVISEVAGVFPEFVKHLEIETRSNQKNIFLLVNQKLKEEFSSDQNKFIDNEIRKVLSETN